MNVACLVGRVASDPQARQTAGGTNYATLRVAVPRGRGRTDFFTVELWGKLAQLALDRVRTGGVVSLRCELEQQQWGPNDARKERTVLVVRKLGLISATSTIMFGDSGTDDLEQQDEERAA